MSDGERHLPMCSASAYLRGAVSRPAAMAAAIALLAATAATSLSRAGELNYSALGSPLVAVDWQPPESLPPRFRNHCSYDVNRGRWYCSNHCGPDYQFYFCTPASFGCCHPGYGYCDWQGRLRCAP